MISTEWGGGARIIYIFTECSVSYILCYIYSPYVWYSMLVCSMAIQFKTTYNLDNKTESKKKIIKDLHKK